MIVESSSFIPHDSLVFRISPRFLAGLPDTTTSAPAERSTRPDLETQLVWKDLPLAMVAYFTQDPSENCMQLSHVYSSTPPQMTTLLLTQSMVCPILSGPVRSW